MSKTFEGLPYMCYHKDEISGETIVIKAGERGYCPIKDEKLIYADHNELNKLLGITKGQAEAMKKGSMFGWDVPFANPANWTDDGVYKK